MNIGKTEYEIWANKSETARKIVNEIIRFGVDDGQILQIIKLLALNLESNDNMREITNLITPMLHEKNEILDLIKEP